MEQTAPPKTSSMSEKSITKGESIQLPIGCQLDSMDTLQKSNTELNLSSTPNSLPFNVDSPFKYDSAQFSQEGVVSSRYIPQEQPIIRSSILMKSQHMVCMCRKATMMVPGGMYNGGRITFFNKRVTRRLRCRKTFLLSL